MIRPHKVVQMHLRLANVLQFWIQQPQDTIDDSINDSNELKKPTLEDPFVPFEEITIPDILKRYIRQPERSHEQIYNEIQQISGSTINQYVKSIIQRNDFFQRSFSKSVATQPSRRIRWLGYELLEFQQQQRPFPRFYTFHDNEEYRELLLSQNDPLVLYNTHAHFESMQPETLKDFLNLVNSLCKCTKPYPLLVLSNMVENLRSILEFCTNVKDEDVQTVLGTIALSCEYQLFFHDEKPHNLVRFLGNIYILIVNYSDVGQYQMFSKMAQNILQHYKELNLEDFGVLQYLMISLIFMNPKDIPKVQREDIIDRFGNYVARLNQEPLISLLGSLIIKQIPTTQYFMAQVLQNPKLTNLQLVDYYIIVQSFKIGNLDISKYMTNIYLGFWNNQLHVKTYTDIKQVLMVARIHEETNNSIVSSIEFALDRKVGKMAQILHESLQRLNLVGRISELIYISNVFNDTLSKQHYAFSQIASIRNEIDVTAENQDLYLTFLSHQKNRFTSRYYYLNQKRWINFQEDNHQPRYIDGQIIESITSSILKKPELEELHFALFELYSCQEVKCSEQNYIKLVKWAGKYPITSAREAEKFISVVSFFDAQDYPIDYAEFEALKIRKRISFSYRDQLTLAQQLKLLYHYVKLRSKVTKDQAAFDSSLEHFHKHYLKDLIARFTANNRFTVKNVDLNDTEQAFLQSYQLPELQSKVIFELPDYEYLLPVLGAFYQRPLKEVRQALEAQIPRVCKSWNDTLLLENLKVIEKFQLNLFETVHLVCAENLTTFLSYNPENSHFCLRFSETVIRDLLNCYLNAFRFYQKTKEYVQQPDTCNSLRILSVFADAVFKELSGEDIITIFEIIGQRRQEYDNSFIKKAQEYCFVLPNKELMAAALVLPIWLENRQFEQAFRQAALESKVANQDQLLALMQQRVFVPTHIPSEPLKDAGQPFIAQNVDQLKLIKYLAVCGTEGHPLVESFVARLWEDRNAEYLRQDQTSVAILFLMKELNIKMESLEQAKVSFVLKVDKTLKSRVRQREVIDYLLTLPMFKPVVSDNDIQSMPSFLSQQMHEWTPQWRVYPSFLNQNVKFPQLHAFLKASTNPTQNKETLNNDVIQIVKYLDKFVWNANPETRKQSEDVPEFNCRINFDADNAMSMSINISNNIPRLGYTRHQNVRCGFTGIWMDQFIITPSNSVPILFAQKEYRVISLNQKKQQMLSFSFELLLQAYLLAHTYGKVYILDADRWGQVYQSRSELERFVHSLLK